MLRGHLPGGVILPTPFLNIEPTQSKEVGMGEENSTHRAQEPGPAETYEEYLAPAISTPWTRVLLEYAAPRCGERALDLACGTGSVARQVAPMVGAEGKVVALDVSPAMLAVARALPPPAGAPIKWREGDAVQLDLPNGSFDLVLCLQGLQFFADRAAAAREMRRVLVEDGRVASASGGASSIIRCTRR